MTPYSKVDKLPSTKNVRTSLVKEAEADIEEADSQDMACPCSMEGGDLIMADTDHTNFLA